MRVWATEAAAAQERSRRTAELNREAVDQAPHHRFRCLSVAAAHRIASIASIAGPPPSLAFSAFLAMAAACPLEQDKAVGFVPSVYLFFLTRLSDSPGSTSWPSFSNLASSGSALRWWPLQSPSSPRCASYFSSCFLAHPGSVTRPQHPEGSRVRHLPRILALASTPRHRPPRLQSGEGTFDVKPRLLQRAQT